MYFGTGSILESLGFGFSLLDDKVFNGRLGDHSRVSVLESSEKACLIRSFSNHFSDPRMLCLKK